MLMSRERMLNEEIQALNIEKHAHYLLRSVLSCLL